VIFKLIISFPTQHNKLTMALLHSASLVVFSSCLEQFGEEEKKRECWTSNLLKILFDTKGKV